MPCLSSCTTAPELLAAAARAGLAIGFERGGGIFVQVANRRSVRQRCAFDALKGNPFVITLLIGAYYPGDFRRVQ